MWGWVHSESWSGTASRQHYRFLLLIYTNSVIRSLTLIGDRVWIGSTTTVLTSAVVPDDTKIGDGEVFKAGKL